MVEEKEDIFLETDGVDIQKNLDGSVKNLLFVVKYILQFVDSKEFKKFKNLKIFKDLNHYYADTVRCKQEKEDFETLWLDRKNK